MTYEELMQTIQGRIIVSCQALPGEPLYIEGDSIMYLMARAAKQAGAAAIRTNGTHDVIAIRAETSLPVIGLIKRNYPGIDPYITSTMREIDALWECEADIVALDCTLRLRENHMHINDFLAAVKEKYPHMLLMADISTFEEGINAWKQGVHFVGTTLSGYTSYSPQQDGPDFALVKALSQEIDIPVIAEGKVHTPEDVVKLLDVGAHAVVVGGAITRPLEIANRFVRAVQERNAHDTIRD